MSISKQIVILSIVPIIFLAITTEVCAQANDVVCDKCINASDIAGGAINASKLKSEAVTNAKISDRAVTSSKIKNRAVKLNKLSNEVRNFVENSIGGLLTGQFSQIDGSGVAALQCPANTLLSSVNCDCDSAGGSRNYGILFACNYAGNGGVAGCFPEAATYNPSLPSANATVGLICIAAVTNDGSVIVPDFFPLAFGGNPSLLSKPETSGIEFEIAENNARAAVAAHLAALQNR